MPERPGKGFAVVASEVRNLAGEAAPVAVTVGNGLARLRQIMKQRLSDALDTGTETPCLRRPSSMLRLLKRASRD